ncbi:four helix bundle protein [Patescibacteria group bacterium]|nr:four helix bundle protein [Patescibacteria group bacterium]
MAKEYRKFYENELWKEAYELQKEVFKLTQTFPKDECYGLISQLNKSSNSVCANIAEEHGRYFFADKIRVLYIVRGELQETQSHLIVSQSRNYVSKEKCTELVNKYENVQMKLNGRINDFYKKKEKIK